MTILTTKTIESIITTTLKPVGNPGAIQAVIDTRNIAKAAEEIKRAMNHDFKNDINPLIVEEIGKGIYEALFDLSLYMQDSKWRKEKEQQAATMMDGNISFLDILAANLDHAMAKQRRDKDKKITDNGSGLITG